MCHGMDSLCATLFWDCKTGTLLGNNVLKATVTFYQIFVVDTEVANCAENFKLWCSVNFTTDLWLFFLITGQYIAILFFTSVRHDFCTENHDKKKLKFTQKSIGNHCLISNHHVMRGTCKRNGILNADVGVPWHLVIYRSALVALCAAASTTR